jgi:hypothetical protein
MKVRHWRAEEDEAGLDRFGAVLDVVFGTVYNSSSRAGL